MMKRRKQSRIRKLLAYLLCFTLLLGLFPAVARAEETEASETTTAPKYSKSDYTYMYLVTVKKDNVKEYDNGKKYNSYDKYSYKYDKDGLVVKSTRDSNRQFGTKGKLGETTYEYDASKNLIAVDGPYFYFVYTYDSSGKLKKYDMTSDVVVMTYDGDSEYKHKLKYRKKDKSIYNPICAGVPLLSSGDRYFFNKNNKPSKMYRFKNFTGNQWASKIYYSYDKKGNLVKRKQKNTGYSYEPTVKYSLTYKSGRLTKRKNSQTYNEVASTTYKYKKVKVLKEYKKQIKEQQWRILNFEDVHEFGIDQPWKY